MTLEPYKRSFRPPRVFGATAPRVFHSGILAKTLYSRKYGVERVGVGWKLCLVRYEDASPESRE